MEHETLDKFMNACFAIIMALMIITLLALPFVMYKMDARVQEKSCVHK